MRMPIKLNSTYWGKRLSGIFPSAMDPRALLSEQIGSDAFTSAVSVLKFENTFKTTGLGRFSKTIQELASLKFGAPPVVLDVGASDGSASIDIIRNIEFDKYYLTDLNVAIFCETHNGVTFFYNENSAPILRASDRLIVYFDPAGAFFPFNLILRLFARNVPKLGGAKKIPLFNPALKAFDNKKISLSKFNMFDQWDGERAYLIIVGNILNECYFSNKEILSVVDNLVSVLNENGRVAIIDNRDSEKSSIFKLMNGVLVLEKSISGGSDIENLISKRGAFKSLRTE